MRYALCVLLVCRRRAPKEGPADRVIYRDKIQLESTRSEGIRRALRELDYVEGQNPTIEYRYAEGKVDRLSALTAGLGE